VPDTEWALLAYRLPREPSTPRIALWRKLRRLGAVQLVDGLVALPADPATVEAFDWLADDVVEAGGEAWTWRADPGSKQQHADLRDRLTAAVSEDYASLVDRAKDAASDPTTRKLERLRKDLHAIEARDHFGSKEREPARRAVARLASALGAAPETAVR
jgi:hypothetical protein